MRNIIRDYLAAPNDKRNGALKALLGSPKEAFETLLNFKGPYPDNIHVVDVFPDYLQPLLSSLIGKLPHLLLEADLTKMDPGKRWILISIAIELKNSEFAPIILAALKDRSTIVRELAVEAVAKLQYLRTPQAKAQLEKLKDLKMKE